MDYKEAFEKLKNDVEKLSLKQQFRVERCRKFRDMGDERFSEFHFGKNIGAQQAYNAVLSQIKYLTDETLD